MFDGLVGRLDARKGKGKGRGRCFSSRLGINNALDADHDLAADLLPMRTRKLLVDLMKRRDQEKNAKAGGAIKVSWLLSHLVDFSLILGFECHGEFMEKAF